MHSSEAVRHLEYVINATTTDGGRRCAAGYRPVLERVESDADGTAVSDLAATLGSEFRAGRHPSPAEAERAADRVLGVATDGGE